MAGSTYTLFLDESGTVEYPKFDPQQPILSVGGAAISDDMVSVLESTLRDFKSRVLNDVDTPLRHTNIVGAKGPFGNLKDRVALRTFLAELYEKTLTKVEFVVFAGVIDKPRYLRTYGTRPVDRHLPQDPHLVALTFVIERFVTFLEQQSSKGRILYEARDPWRNAYDQWEYVTMHVKGTQYLRRAQFNKRLPSWIEFVPKSEGMPGLELADLIIGPVARRVNDPSVELIEWSLHEERFWRGSNPSAPGQIGFKVFPGDLGRELLGHPRS